ncbi:MAG TPA: hypothetical protein EYG79_03290 [Rhodobacteraceae bacterium]|nr:hypothetical protein [Paracoccaceae bacterium]
MARFKLSILALAGLTLAACQEEAGFDPRFPPVGGARPIIMPDAGMPTDLTPTDPVVVEPSTEALSAAVNEALNASEPANSSSPEVAAVDPSTGDDLASDSGVLNLAEQSQSEQLRLREADAAALAAAAAQRVIIQPEEMPAVVSGANIITFARETTNAVGERVYRRPSIRRTSSASQCRKFGSADDAQRNFLANGGPQDDPLNLDPDGDGFACRWSPEAYRALVLN